MSDYLATPRQGLSLTEMLDDIAIRRNANNFGESSSTEFEDTLADVLHRRAETGTPVTAQVDTGREAAAPNGEEDEFTPLYNTVEEWVQEVFVACFARRVRARWCRRWWDHPEAIVLLTSMWQTWELAQGQGPDDLRRWLTDAMMPLRGELVSEEGPFSACTLERHTRSDPWPVESSPPGIWDL